MRHRGDIMSPEKRRIVKSKIRGRAAGPERTIAAALEVLGLHCETQVKDLLGRPDFLFNEQRVVVFVDGDFWHGWRFPLWRDKTSEKWEAKIEVNRRRDLRNHRRLRREGLKVIRVLEQQIKKDPAECGARVAAILGDIPVLSNCGLGQDPTTPSKK